MNERLSRVDDFARSKLPLTCEEGVISIIPETMERILPGYKKEYMISKDRSNALNLM